MRRSVFAIAGLFLCLSGLAGAERAPNQVLLVLPITHHLPRGQLPSVWELQHSVWGNAWLTGGTRFDARLQGSVYDGPFDSLDLSVKLLFHWRRSARLTLELIARLNETGPVSLLIDTLRGRERNWSYLTVSFYEYSATPSHAYLGIGGHFAPVDQLITDVEGQGLETVAQSLINGTYGWCGNLIARP
jgi:hypothetical protein